MSEESREFIKKESKSCELDAVHPRFKAEEDAKVIRDVETCNYYYCEMCDLFFAPTFRGLQTHFRDEIKRHQAISSCFYCQGPVYEYKFKDEARLYHNCKDKEKMLKKTI